MSKLNLLGCYLHTSNIREVFEEEIGYLLDFVVLQKPTNQESEISSCSLSLVRESS